MARVGALLWMMRVAVATEPEITALLDDPLQQRRQGMVFFVGALLHAGPLREGLGAEQAVDSVWALTSPEVYRLLTLDRGWSEEAYEAWLAQTLERTLLP
jgi:hypothetical protein